MRSGDSRIWYSFTSPPSTATCATPPVARRRGRMVQSAIVRKSLSDVVSAVRATNISSPRIDDCGPIVGWPAVAGRLPVIVDSFSDTVCRARYMSVPQSNSTQTTENPVVDDERTRLTPVAPLTDVSIGNVTSRSTSSAAMPFASFMMTTVGALRSGKTSTSIVFAVNIPTTMMSTAAISIARRLCRAMCIILSKNIVSSGFLLSLLLPCVRSSFLCQCLFP